MEHSERGGNELTFSFAGSSVRFKWHTTGSVGTHTEKSRAAHSTREHKSGSMVMLRRRSWRLGKGEMRVGKSQMRVGRCQTGVGSGSKEVGRLGEGFPE